ncbi:zinc finger protein 2 [Galendromus occidentalis]|uniref:Zinc finger protein 2 n=1 Tax=Galendromus occidentalis TaxID=34638 RepID=A0AAJ6VZP5_9ACAR|nr:zinc finger protein 2 [Galendromus occidentalis]
MSQVGGHDEVLVARDESRSGELPIRVADFCSPSQHSLTMPSADIPQNGTDERFQLDFQNAINLGTESVVEISGVTHVLHIDFECQQALAIPLKPVEEKARELDLETLGALLGRRGPGRPSLSATETVSIVVLTKLISVLVQVPLDDVPPTLKLSQLGDRILKTIVQYEELSATSTLDLDTEEGPLTLNVSLAVLKGTVDWVDDVTLVPVYRTYPVEDPEFFKEISLRGVIDEEIQCPFCDFYSFYEGHMSRHLQAGHRDFVDDTNTMECRKCHVVLPGSEFFRHHVRKHPNLVCLQCGVVVEQTNQMRRHNERHDSLSPNHCEVCGKIYKDQYILRSHMKLVHGEPLSLHECFHCQKRFDRKAHLIRHLKHTHTDLKPFACDMCDYRSNARGDLNKHLLIHSEPSFRCGQCGKCFTHRKSLVLHEKRHLGLREFKCGLCDYLGYTHNHVRRHIERVHGNTDLRSAFDTAVISE